MTDDANIWSASFFHMKKTVTIFTGYCVSLLLIFIMQDYFKLKSGSFMITVFAQIFLSFYVFLSILSDKNINDAVKDNRHQDPKGFRNFSYRAIALGLIATVPTFILVIVLTELDFPSTITISMAVLFILILMALVFTKWGTMLPAVIAQGDTTFSRAGERGSLTFSYTFSRLLICFGLFSVLEFLVIGTAAMLLKPGDSLFPVTGGFDYATFFILLMAAIGSGYQVIMMSVVLSRAYLQAEDVIANRNGLVAPSSI